jgi:hypothetical protein
MNFDDNGTRNFPAYGAVPESNAPPRARYWLHKNKHMVKVGL